MLSTISYHRHPASVTPQVRVIFEIDFVQICYR